MKIVFGILSLVVAMAVVFSIAKKQLQATGGSGGGGSIATRGADAERKAKALAADLGGQDGATRAIPGGVAGAVAADPLGSDGGTVAQQAKGMQDRARDNTVRALQQGADRTRQAADR